MFGEGPPVLWVAGLGAPTSPMRRLSLSALPLARLRCRGVASLAAAVRVLAASPTAARESPTPVLLLGGLGGGGGGGGGGAAATPAARLALAQHLSARGFEVALLDLDALLLRALPPDTEERAGGGGASAAAPAAASAAAAAALDAVVAALRSALTRALAAPPVAVAPDAAALLLHKYLESWPLAGLVAVDPLPPDARPLLRRWGAPLAAAAGGGVAADAAAVQRALPGASAPAARLVALLARDPVRLEPRPVPLRVLLTRGGGAASLRGGDDEARATSRFHGLDDEDTVELDSGGGAEEDAALRRELDAFMAPRF